MPTSPSTRTSASTMSKMVANWIRRLALYDMIQASRDFEDVKAALDYKTDRSIELFRSCFAVHLSSSNCFFMPITLFFLVLAESIQHGYGRLSSTELKELAERIGHMAFSLMFALLFAVLDVGFIVVRIVVFVAVSGSPALAACLVLISMSPLAIFLILAYIARLLSGKRESNEDSHQGV